MRPQLLTICLALMSCFYAPRLIAVPLTEVQPAPDQSANGTQNEEPGDYGDNWGSWWTRPTVFSSVAQATFAAFLFALTIVQCVMLYKANKTASEAITKADVAIQKADEANQAANRSAHAAEQANVETKRSVDAYMNSERGSMRFHKGAIGPHGLRLNFAFKNIGKGTVVLTHFAYHVQALNGQAPLFEKLTEGHSFSVAIPPNSCFTTFPIDGCDPDPILTMYTGLQPLPEFEGEGPPSYVAQYRLIYTDQFGKVFECRSAVLFDGLHARALHSPDFTFEGPMPTSEVKQN